MVRVLSFCFFLFLVVLPVSAKTASPQARAAGALSSLFKHEVLLNKLEPAERTHFTVRAYIRQKDGLDVHLWLGEGAEKERITLGPDGAVLWHPSPQQLRDNPQLYTTAPENSLSLSLTLHPVLPITSGDGKKQVAVSDMRKATGQANKAVRKAAGLMSVMAPKFKKVTMQVPLGETPVLVFENGARAAMQSTSMPGWFSFDTKERDLKKVRFIEAVDFTEFGFAR